MTDTPRPFNRHLTLVGFSPADEEPFPLRPYCDVAVFTPTGTRKALTRGTTTPVYIPPARRHTQEEIAAMKARRSARRAPPRARPGLGEQVAAAVVVSYLVLAALTLIH